MTYVFQYGVGITATYCHVGIIMYLKVVKKQLIIYVYNVVVVVVVSVSRYLRAGRNVHDFTTLEYNVHSQIFTSKSLQSV